MIDSDGLVWKLLMYHLLWHTKRLVSDLDVLLRYPFSNLDKSAYMRYFEAYLSVNPNSDLRWTLDRSQLTFSVPRKIANRKEFGSCLPRSLRHQRIYFSTVARRTGRD